MLRVFLLVSLFCLVIDSVLATLLFYVSEEWRRTILWIAVSMCIPPVLLALQITWREQRQAEQKPYWLVQIPFFATLLVLVFLRLPREIFFPVMCVLIVLPAGIIRWMSRRDSIREERFRRGLCLTCGYDLRGGHERCPECGRAVDPRRQ